VMLQQKGTRELMHLSVVLLSNMYFASADKDASGDLNFDEFLELYSQLEKIR